MHKICEDKGTYNIIYQIPELMYSFFILFFFTLLKLFSLSESLILEFKEDKKKGDVNENMMKLEKKLKIKYILYFIVSFILLLVFWYYISMFCAIYVNTQIHLIKNTLFCFGLSLFYPLLINLIPRIFRITALSSYKTKKNYFSTFCKILQII